MAVLIRRVHQNIWKHCVMFVNLSRKKSDITSQ